MHNYETQLARMRAKSALDLREYLDEKRKVEAKLAKAQAILAEASNDAERKAARKKIKTLKSWIKALDSLIAIDPEAQARREENLALEFRLLDTV